MGNAEWGMGGEYFHPSPFPIKKSHAPRPARRVAHSHFLNPQPSGRAIHYGKRLTTDH
ncbi:hypothetical protein I41_06170 [Lacipirellula limnantheis]|uniref:Uncharacterized protein n=1 Tax=Lacipirellula limnantheis TaxID=2528024 RepID=A0A517TSV7_9BACT|nr:hypothetical protein I41_06170 [Lacipirellula limnantheis]